MPAWLGFLIWFVVLIFNPTAAMVILVIALLLGAVGRSGGQRDWQRGPGE